MRIDGEEISVDGEIECIIWESPVWIFETWRGCCSPDLKCPLLEDSILVGERKESVKLGIRPAVYAPFYTRDAWRVTGINFSNPCFQPERARTEGLHDTTRH